jgi:hypothetical protein
MWLGKTCVALPWFGGYCLRLCRGNPGSNSNPVMGKISSALNLFPRWKFHPISWTLLPLASSSRGPHGLRSVPCEAGSKRTLSSRPTSERLRWGSVISKSYARPCVGMKVASLFSGCGGLDVGLHQVSGIRNVPLSALL